MSVNRGIRLTGNTLFTYEKNKKAIVYYHMTRKVHDDFIHTSAHDTELQPKKRKKTQEDTDITCDEVVFDDIYRNYNAA